MKMDPGSVRTDARSAVRRALRAVPVGTLVVLALLFALLLLLAREVLESMGVGTADLELLHLLHRVGGAAAALAAAGLASWLLLRDAPPLLAESPLSNGRSLEGRSDPNQQRVHYARWFILMRWIAVVVAAMLALTAVEIAAFLPPHVGPHLGAVIVGLAVSNVGYAVYLRRGRAGTGFLVLQTYGDIVALLLLLHFSGGIENPLTPLLLLHVIIAGIVLGRLHCYAVASVTSVLFAMLAAGEWSGILAHYTLSVFPHVHIDGHMVHAAHDPLYVGSRVVLHGSIMLLVAYFTTTLVERIRQDDQQLEVLAERALAQAQLLERALDTAGAALCVCDRERHRYWSNGRWEEWMQGRSAMQWCGNDGGPPPSAETLEDGRVRVTEVRIEGESGCSTSRQCADVRTLQLTTAPLRNRDGQISHVVTLARDVTAEHEARLRVIRAERMAAVGELAGQVAHEVNNPIAIISAKGRLLLRDSRSKLPQKATQELEKMVDLADRVARIAQGLLSYCRPSPGVRSLVDIRLPIRRALAFIDGRAAEAGVRIMDELPAALPPVQANASELEQVFLNLFINSLDALPPGGRLRVAAWVDPERGHDGAGWLQVVVEDTGSGIPAAIRERIFDPFLTTKAEGRGSGLGLSICQGLVRSHGGEISVVSEPGQPTRVTLELPVAPDPSQPSLQDSRPGWQEVTADV
jgi:signal transduction histidine kinase